MPCATRYVRGQRGAVDTGECSATREKMLVLYFPGQAADQRVREGGWERERGTQPQQNKASLRLGKRKNLPGGEWKRGVDGSLFSLLSPSTWP
jgi:hypothetical protein